jgi:Ca2+-binding RTX toxin-like protein
MHASKLRTQIALAGACVALLGAAAPARAAPGNGMFEQCTNPIAGLVGGAGDDNIVGTAAGEGLWGNAGMDCLASRDGNDRLMGGAGSDELGDGAGNDTVHGGSEWDAILGGAGNDSLYGDDGDDYLVATDGEVDYVDCGPGFDEAYVDAIDKVVNCENLGVAEQPLNTIWHQVECKEIVTGTPAPDVWNGGPGDSFRGLGGNDLMTGTEKQNCLFGDAGDDKLDGRGHKDQLTGGAGNDTLDGGKAGFPNGANGVQANQYFDQTGNDTVTGGPGSDWIQGGSGKDSFSGGDLNDHIVANDGHADTVDCGKGDDQAWIDELDKAVGCEHVSLL